MKIGKFKLQVQYDMCCAICGEYRSNIGFSMPMSKKPTVSDLKLEGWNVVDGIGNICPNCNNKIGSVTSIS